MTLPPSPVLSRHQTVHDVFKATADLVRALTSTPCDRAGARTAIRNGAMPSLVEKDVHIPSADLKPRSRSLICETVARQEHELLATLWLAGFREWEGEDLYVEAIGAQRKAKNPDWSMLAHIHRITGLSPSLRVWERSLREETTDLIQTLDAMEFLPRDTLIQPDTQRSTPVFYASHASVARYLLQTGSVIAPRPWKKSDPESTWKTPLEYWLSFAPEHLETPDGLALTEVLLDHGDRVTEETLSKVCKEFGDKPDFVRLIARHHPEYQWEKVDRAHFLYLVAKGVPSARLEKSNPALLDEFIEKSPLARHLEQATPAAPPPDGLSKKVRL